MRLDQQVLCIIFRESSSRREFLLLRRIPEKGAFWQPVSGGVEDTDASFEAAVRREVLEETGIKDIISLTPEVHSFVIDRHYLTGEPVSPVTEHVFGVKVPPGVEVTLEENIYPEHDSFRWVSFDEALGLLEWENNKDGLRRLRSYLERG